MWGRPSVPGDFAYATPELLGTERTGPDLTNVGARQADLWNEIHLYQPRSLVAQSIMPSYRWLFITKAKAETGDVVVPVPAPFAPPGETVVATPDVLALVAYLHQLKQAPLEKAAKMNGMQMSPPAGGDPIGMAITIAGSIVLLASFARGIYCTIRPSKHAPDHPMYAILRDDR